MTAEDERYIFFQECLTSLNTAWCILDALSDTKAHKTLAWAAYRMAFIEYAKPYRNSRGIHVKNYFLPVPDISSENRRLHDLILHLRDTSLAHSDLTIKEAQLYFGRTENNPFPLIISNTDTELPTHREFRQLIELTLEHLYCQLPSFKVIDAAE